MSLDERAFENLGKAVAAEIGTGDSEFTLRRQEPLFLAAMAQAQKQPLQKSRTKIWILSASVSAAAAAAILLALTLSPAETSYLFNVDGTAGAESGVWISASGNRSRDIAFAQGSRFSLENGTLARVASANDEKVQIELRRGRLHASVHGNGHTRWVVDAAPYTITVVGTKFTVDKPAIGDAVVVEVTEGTVLVQGADLASHGVKVTAGFRLSADAELGTATLSSRNGEATPATDVTSLRTTPASEASKKTAANAGSGRTDIRKNATADDTWLSLYEAKDFAGAMEAARRSGLDRIIKTAPADDLWKLGDATRNVRDDATARTVLTTYRTRFPTGRKAPVAAFLLGRMAVENDRNPASAAQWFDLCLKESGNGAMAQDALGRLMGALHDSGQDARAKEAARNYLTRYSDGVHARLARSILAE